MRPRVLYSGFRFSHHNPGSGYHEVVDSARDYVCGNALPFASQPESSLLRHVNFLLVDLVTLVRGVRYDAVHYFYPENTAYVSPWPLRLLGKRIVYTLHLTERDWLGPVRSPFMRLKQLSLRSAHALVVLSRTQQHAYSQQFPHKTVRFVPHGFAFDGAPANGPEQFARRRQQRRMLVVGQNYRDLDLLERIVKARGERAVELHLVGMDERIHARFAAYPGVVSYPRLDRDSYETLLRSAQVLLLPLTFATANNALLEAYNLGVPVLASRIPGITDYAVDGERGLFATADELWAKYDALAQLDDATLRDRSATLQREAARRFDWRSVRAELRQLYADVTTKVQAPARSWGRTATRSKSRASGWTVGPRTADSSNRPRD